MPRECSGWRFRDAGYSGPRSRVDVGVAQGPHGPTAFHSGRWFLMAEGVLVSAFGIAGWPWPSWQLSLAPSSGYATADSAESFASWLSRSLEQAGQFGRQPTDTGVGHGVDQVPGHRDREVDRRRGDVVDTVLNRVHDGRRIAGAKGRPTVPGRELRRRDQVTHVDEQLGRQGRRPDRHAVPTD